MSWFTVRSQQPLPASLLGASRPVHLPVAYRHTRRHRVTARVQTRRRVAQIDLDPLARGVARGHGTPPQ